MSMEQGIILISSSFHHKPVPCLRLYCRPSQKLRRRKRDEKNLQFVFARIVLDKKHDILSSEITFTFHNISHSRTVPCMYDPIVFNMIFSFYKQYLDQI